MVGLILALLALDSPPAAAGTTVDEGTFDVWMGKELAGREQFRVVRTPSGFEIQSTSIAQGGNTNFMALRGTLRTNRKWQPLSGHFDASVGGRLTTIDLSGPPTGLKLVTRIRGDRPSTVRARERVDLVVVQNMIAHLLPLCGLAEASPTELIAFPDAPVTVFPPSPQTFSMQPPGSGAAAKVQLPVIYVDFPAFRTQLVCKDGKLIALRQGRFDITAARPGYEKIPGELAY
jgi:hypothetical protein